MGLGSSGGETCQVKNKSNFSKTSSIRATILVSFMILFFSFLMCGQFQGLELLKEKNDQHHPSKFAFDIFCNF
jgi:hypothetical protein